MVKLKPQGESHYPREMANQVTARYIGLGEEDTDIAIDFVHSR